MSDIVKSSYMTDEQFERILYLCACRIGTIKRLISIKSILDIGNGKYELNVVFRGCYQYKMVYDGKMIIECVRVIETVC